MDGFIQFLTVLIIFIFVLFITYFTTKWVGNIQKGQYAGRNIELLDAGRLTQTQYIQVVRVGKKVLILGISKDNITLLGECQMEDLEVSTDDKTGTGGIENFQMLLEKAKSAFPRK